MKTHEDPALHFKETKMQILYDVIIGVTYMQESWKTLISRPTFKEKVLALTQKISKKIYIKHLLYLT